jgi:hypothetical protein
MNNTDPHVHKSHLKEFFGYWRCFPHVQSPGSNRLQAFICTVGLERYEKPHREIELVLSSKSRNKLLRSVYKAELGGGGVS